MGDPVGHFTTVVLQSPVEALAALLKFNGVPNEPGRKSGGKPPKVIISPNNTIMHIGLLAYGRRVGENRFFGKDWPASALR